MITPRECSHRTLAVAVAALSLALSACSAPASPQDPAPSATPASWGDWRTLDYSASIVTGSRTHVVVFNHDEQALEVFDREGKKVWNVPDGVGDQRARVVSGDAALYVQADNGDVTALNWEDGKSLWTFDSRSVSECIPTSTLTLGSGDGGTRLAEGDPLLLSYSTDLSAESDSSSSLPEHCLTSNADAASVPVVTALDPATGERKWTSGETSIINEVGVLRHDPQGRYVFHIDSHRAYPGLVRTEVKTGESVSVGLVGTMLPDRLATDIWVSPYTPDDFTLEITDAEGNRGTTFDAHADRWATEAQTRRGEPGTVRMHAAEDEGDLCKSAVFRTAQTDVPLCLSTQLKGKYTVAPVGNKGPEKAWTAAADLDLNDAGGDAHPLGDDPIVPREGKSPLIALPTPGGALTAFALDSGDQVWNSRADKAKSFANSPTYIPATGQLVYSQGEHVIAVDGISGRPDWDEPLIGGTLGMFTATANAVAAKMDGANGQTTHIRFVHDG